MVSTEQEPQKSSLAQLLHLFVEVNNRILKIEEQIKKITVDIHDYKVHSLKLTTSLQELEKLTLSARKKVTTAEAELKFMQAKELEKRQKLETVENNKEYKALSKDIEQLKKQNSSGEEQLLTFWQEAESLEKKLEEEQIRTQKKLEELTQNLLTANQTITNLKEVHKNLIEEKNVKSAIIPNEWISRFTRMQNSVPDPIVSAINTCCGGCFYQIVAQEYTRIKKGEVLLCRSCYRFLYFDNEQHINTQPNDKVQQP